MFGLTCSTDVAAGPCGYCGSSKVAVVGSLNSCGRQSDTALAALCAGPRHAVIKWNADGPKCI